MKYFSTLNLFKLTLPIIFSSVFAANSVDYVDPQLIIKFQATPAQQKLINGAKNNKEKLFDIEKVNAELMQKLSSSKIQLFSKLAGADLIDLAPYALGGRVVTFKHKLTQAQLDGVISRLRKIPGIAQVQRDEQVTMDSVVSLNEHNWHLYDTSIYTGTDSVVYKRNESILYGDDFFDKNSFVEYKGAGVTIAVLDTGYVPHPNFISHLQADENGKYGYTFIEDCSERGACPNPPAKIELAPTPDGLDIGNYLSKKDIEYYFPGKTTIPNQIEDPGFKMLKLSLILERNCSLISGKISVKKPSTVDLNCLAV